MAEAVSPDSPAADVGNDSFHQIVRRCSASVGIVTAGGVSGACGVTCTSFTALSITPPRLLINLDANAETLNAIAQSGVLGLNILNAAQEEVAARFSVANLSDVQQFNGFLWFKGRSDVPLLQHAAAALECAVEEIIERHSHALIICRVTRCNISDDISALVFWNDQYREIQTDDDLVLLAEMSGPTIAVRA